MNTEKTCLRLGVGDRAGKGIRSEGLGRQAHGHAQFADSSPIENGFLVFLCQWTSC